MRPANIITAISDILAGIAIAGGLHGLTDLSSPLLLILSTIGLYGGGVVFNDVFDASLDKSERPERPIPSELITKTEGSILGIVLLIIGIVSASLVVIYPSGALAIAIAISALVYDKWGKHHILIGPLNMGLCRGLNLLLGMSFVPEALSHHLYLGIVPIIYIAAITMISRGEVHGGTSKVQIVAALLYGIVISTLGYISLTNDTIWQTSILIALLAAMIFPPLIISIRQPAGKNNGRAVKAGVLALIIMNSCWAAAFGDLYLALVILLLLPFSLFLARIFAVT